MKNKEIEELLKYLKNKFYISGEFYTEEKIKVLSKKELELLLSYIEQLEKKVDQYENPDDLTLFYMWLDTKAKDKMKQLEKRNKELYEGFMATQEELTDYATKNEQLENNRDKAIEVINTQLKNAEGGIKDNLRIIKFNLIKGSCTFEDLKTEEDYKYVLKGGSDE
jgi:hypothetical protein